MELINIAMWGSGAVIVVGIIQWFKSVIKKAPSWVWMIVSVMLSFLAAFAGNSTLPVYDALGILAISQIGYELIIQNVKNALKPKG